MSKTHTLLWNWKCIDAAGAARVLNFSTPFALAEWDDPREAALWFGLVEERAYLERNGWTLGKPRDIQVYAVRPLSDCGLS